METGDPLSGLRDIHTPAIPDGLSIAPILVGALALFTLLVVAGIVITRLRRRWAREIVASLNQLDASHPDVALSEAAKLLRRVAILRLGPGAARLQGSQWLAALDQLFRTRFFSSGEGRVFADALYAPQLSAASAKPVLAKLRQLVRRQAWLPW